MMAAADRPGLASLTRQIGGSKPHPAPDWIWEIPDARFKNQYGSEFKVGSDAELEETGGTDFGNMTFNPKIRAAMAGFITRFFEDFRDYKDKIWAVDLNIGGGGDVWFPYAWKWKGEENCYWAFDRNAQSVKKPGSLAGPNPVPGWIPGTHDDPTHDKAKKFLNWYLESGNQVVLWEIALFRKHYQGLIMLAADAFFKKVDLAPHIASDLDGSVEDPETPYWSPAAGFSDGRYLKTVIEKYGAQGFFLHHTGLEKLEPREVEFAERFMNRIGGENANMNKEGLGEGETIREVFDTCIGLVKKHRLGEFMWMFSDAVYVGNLTDPAFDVSPDYFEQRIREINGPAAAISDIRAKRLSASQAEITWKTDEPADSRVVFCADRQMRTDARAVHDPVKTKDHRIIMPISAGKPVYFEVGSDNGKSYSLSSVQALEAARP